MSNVCNKSGRGRSGIAMVVVTLILLGAGAAEAATISGTVYTDEGVTNAGAGLTVKLIVNGVDTGTNVTDAAGAYSIVATLSAGDAMLVFVNNGAVDATTVTVSDGTDLSGFDIYADHVITRHDNGGSLTNADMDTAVGAFSDNEIEYSVSAGVLTVPSPNELYVPTGHTFVPGANVTAYDVEILGTIDGGADTLTIERHWLASAGTFTAGTSTVEFTEDSATFTPGASAYNNVTVNLKNNQTLTLGSALDVNGNLTISAETLDVSASNYAITVAGNFTNLDTFTARSGTVTLDGTGQTISGSTTFYNLTKSIAAADTLTFAAGQTTTISGTVTLNGTAGNLLSLRSDTPGTRWNFTVNAGATKAIDYVDVQDSDVSGSDPSHIRFNPPNFVNSGNNIDWFDEIISGTVYSDEGVTNAGSGLTVRLIVNGVDAGSDVTDAGGAYSITATVLAGDAILVYVDNDATIDATTVTIAPGANLSGFDIYADHVITRHDNGGSLTNADMDTAVGAFSDAEIEYSVSAGVLTVPSPNELYIPTGHTFAPGGDVTTFDIEVLGTIVNGGSDKISVENDWVAAAGTFSGSGTVQFTSGSATFTPGASSYSTVTVALNIGATLTLGGALDVNNNLRIQSGTLDVSTSNYAINLAGNFTNLDTFTARAGTVTLDGTNQIISGSTTFYNLTKSVAVADILTFDVGETQTINGTVTLSGAAGNLLSLRSSIPGTRWNFTVSAGATKAIDYVDVQDSDASGSDATQKPIGPTNSVDSGNTIDWFSFPTITLSKSADVTTAEPGDTITYTLTYGNTGPGDATNLVITDTIPTNTTLVPGSISGGGTESGGVITWNLGPLLAGQINRTVTFAVTVDAGVLAGVVIDNDATANFDDSGGAPQTPVTSNTVNITVDQVGGVSVEADQIQSVPSATGSQVSYTFTVTNTGNGNDEFDLSLQKSGPEFWPSELLDATGTVLIAQDTDADGIWDFVNPAFDFDADGLPDTGTLAAGATLDVILRLTVPPGTTPGDQEITSLIGTSHFGPVEDRATATSTATSNVDSPIIAFTKTDTPDPVLSNQAITYTLNYNNTGNKPATGLVIVDSIPADVTFVGGSAFGESGVTIEFSINNGTTWGAEPADPTTVTDIRWTVGNLQKNSGVQSAGFVVQPDIALPDGSVIDNIATLSNNQLPVITATASTTVRSAVAFTDSTKTVTPTLASPGATLLYTIFVTNSGVAPGTNVVVTDLLPLETSYVPGSITGLGADDSGAPTLSWSLGVVPAGTTIGPLTYQVVVDNPVTAGTFFIENVASIDSDQTLPANTTKATTVLTGAPLFSGSTKTAQDLDGGSLLVGDTIEYRVDVINTGDMNASGVVVTDIIPADTTYVPGSITGLGADDSAAPNLSWNIGNLAVGVPSIITFRATVNGGLPVGTQISNLAQIVSDQTAAVSTPPVTNTVGGGMTGTIQSTSPIVPGASVLIRITDADLNTDSGTLQSFTETTTNTVTGETELLTYTETGPNTGTFEATVSTVFGIVAGTNDDGVFNVQAGDTLETTYNDALTSSGAPGSATATTIVTSPGVTGTLVSTTPINPGDPVTITLTDADLNVDPGVAETIILTTTNSVSGESEALVYTETGVNTGVFTATVATVFGIVAGTDDDGTFNVQAGDSLSSIYNDAITATGGPGVAVATTDVLSAGVSGTISSTPTIFPFDVVTFTLTDADLNTDPGVADTIILTTTNSVTGESEALVYTETGVNTGVFTATVATVFGTAAGTDDDGTFNVQAGDSLTTTYNDAISNTGGPATDIATTNVLAGSPDIQIAKIVSTLEDPVNGMTNPKAIPRAIVLYAVQLTNFGVGPADADTVTISDPIPADLALRVVDYDGGNPGPVAFVDGSPSSDLSYTFISLGSSADDVEFSNDGGSTWTYTPVDSGDGSDPAVTDIRVNLKGTFAGSLGGGDPNFEVQFKAIVL